MNHERQRKQKIETGARAARSRGRGIGRHFHCALARGAQARRRARGTFTARDVVAAAVNSGDRDDRRGDAPRTDLAYARPSVARLGRGGRTDDDERSGLLHRSRLLRLARSRTRRGLVPMKRLLLPVLILLAWSTTAMSAPALAEDKPEP